MMKTIEEIRKRYDLTDQKSIAIFVVLWILIMVGLGAGILELAAESAAVAPLIMGIITTLLFLFLLIYAMFGYKMRILSFQIILLIFAACYAVLCGLNFYGGDYTIAITNLLIIGCLVGFTFTIKRTAATPRVLLVAALALQVPVTIGHEVLCFSTSPINWVYVAKAFQMVVLHLVVGGIYYSRIARHPIIDSSKANEKSFK
jgi:hypothetical protein